MDLVSVPRRTDRGGAAAGEAPAARGTRRTLLAHVAVGAVCGLAWSTGLRGFMAQVVHAEGSTVTWTGTFAWVIAPGVGTGILLGWAAYVLRHGGSPRARRLIWAPFLFTLMLVPPVVTLDLEGFLAGGIGGGGFGVPVLGVLGGYALAGTRTWARVLAALAAASAVPVWALTAASVGGPDLALTQPRGLWVALYYWSHLLVLALACSIPLRIRAAAAERA